MNDQSADPYTDAWERSFRNKVLEVESLISVDNLASHVAPKGVFEEHHLSDAQLSSPIGARLKARSETPETGDRTIEVSSFKDTSKSAIISESIPINDKSLLSLPALAQKKQLNDFSINSVMVDDVVNENLNIFGGKPFRRSIETLSVWKLPWYCTSLVNCLRFDADLTIEDVGIFMSPGTRGLDAIGLMKHINEQDAYAYAYADAHEVLGNETPESILRQRSFRNNVLEGESLTSADHLASNVAPKGVCEDHHLSDAQLCSSSGVRLKAASESPETGGRAIKVLSFKDTPKSTIIVE